MKKKFITLILIIISIFTITGCSSKNAEKEIITDTKTETEKIVSSMHNTGILNQESFTMYFLSLSRDLQLNLEKQNDAGKKVFIMYNDGNYNNKAIGKDSTDQNKYYVLIGSENYEELWSYGTIDLTTGTISWEDNLQK